MNRQEPYGDTSANRYDAHRNMQQNAQINSNYPGQPQVPLQRDGRQQWDTSTQLELNPMSPHSYSQGKYPSGHEGNTIQSLSQERMANNDPMQSYEQGMEIGYEDSRPSELNFEGLERKLQDEIINVIKEHINIEDEEIARHKERIIEINTRYQEKLSSIRVEHAAQIEEFLRKESQARLHHYQQASLSTHQTERGPTGPRYYGWPVATEAPRPYETMPNNTYREHHSQYHGAERRQGSEGRVPYPHGRAYNNSGASF